MKFSGKLAALRGQSGLSQEKLAERLAVSRQAVTKWENGQALPEVDKLILLSELFGISVDQLVKEGEHEDFLSQIKKAPDTGRILEFLLSAKKNTYAAKGAEGESSRPSSHDYQYEKGNMKYIDTFLGSYIFSGQEAVWEDDIPRWAMDYHGRVLDDTFSGDFLKEALLRVPEAFPYRGPLVYQRDSYVYHNRPEGMFEWFHGVEEIYSNHKKIYECRYMGGILR